MLRIEWTKQADEAVVLRCTRQDGSATWQKQTKHAVHFALHDLTHYAVETVFGYRRGFFGLIEEGWEVEDTTGKGGRGALPEETVEVEKLVGLFDMERGSGVLWTEEEFNGYAPREMTEEQIQRVRTLRGELFQRWRQTPVGGTLEVMFGGG